MAGRTPSTIGYLVDSNKLEWPCGSPRAGTIATPTSIVAGPDGNIWYTNFAEDSIGRIDPSGALARFPTAGAASPRDIAVGSDGNLWFAASGGDAIGRVIVEMPAGPGLEILESQSNAVNALREAFSETMGQPVGLEIRAAGDSGPARLTAEQLRDEQLRKLSDEEPGIGRAVEEWDLELLD